MKIASYNVQSLFDRAIALNLDTWDTGKVVLKLYRDMNSVLMKEKYTARDKDRIVEGMKALGLDNDDIGPYVILRQNKGKLVKRSGPGVIEVVADGRASWQGWLELKEGPVNDRATENTARVIRDVDADVLAIVEGESRPALVRFSKELLARVAGTPYEHIMLIDGNDDRGIDVGIMLRTGYEIIRMRSHVDDEDEVGQVFSRDCAEYVIRTPKGNEFAVLVNHFKSKGYGSPASNDRKRQRQARRVKAIYEEVVASGVANVMVVGDFNDTPDRHPLAPLLQETDLRDVSTHPSFDDGGRPGTFGSGAPSNKIDYILLAPPLFAAVQRGGIFRMGVWGGKHGTLFPHYNEITQPVEAASDHAAIWCELDI